MYQWTFFNDDFAESKKTALHYTDLAIQRAYGVFDFFKVIGGVEQSIDEHLNRFYNSASEMRLEIRFNRLELKDIIQKLILKNEFRYGGMKITLTGGYSEDGFEIAKPNLIIACVQLPDVLPDAWKKGIELVTYQHQRQLPHIKTIDYIMPIWLRPVIQSKHADDVLYCSNNIVTECPRSNFYIVTDNKLITPKENILKGITRKRILHAASRFLEVEEREVTLHDVYHASGALISSTSKIVLPVNRIDHKQFKSSLSISERLRDLLNEDAA
jgi:Branched-chain amino acid aminotransferase/4-amino-4-deoxychorismate lyase